jgi:hypothetical protein
MTESKDETEGSQDAATPPHGVGHILGHARGRCGPLVHFLMPPFRLYIPLDGKT